jgi:GTP1/Obg family GTP-binding protein
MKDIFYFEDKYLTVSEKVYDISQLGNKLEEIEPKMQKLFDQYGETPKFIKEVRKLLIECITEDDLPKALTIIDWVEGATETLKGDYLTLIEDKDEVSAISTIAYDMGNRDFGFDLMGYCKDLGYVNISDND